VALVLGVGVGGYGLGAKSAVGISTKNECNGMGGGWE